MQKKSLSRRLAVLLATPLVILTISSLLLYRQIVASANEALWADHSSRVLATVNDAMAQILDQFNAVRGYSLTHDTGFLDRFDAGQPDELLGQLHTFVSDNAAQKSRVDELRRAYSAWRAWAAGARAPQPPQEAEHALLGQTLMNQVRTTYHSFVDAEKALQEQRTAGARDSMLIAKRAFLGLMLGTALVIGFLSRRQLLAIANSYDHALDSERQARARLEDQDWINSSLVRISEATQGELSLDELATKAVTALADITGASIGAFFVAEADGIRLRGGYALDRKAIPKRFRLGEGLAGQAARDKRQMVVREVPREYLRVTSASGAHQPVTIVLQPLITGGSAFALAELGFLGPVRERELRLLQTASESIAVTVRSTEYRTRLNELLIQTQRQAEELQAQQEELRVSNEELEERERSLREVHNQMQATQSNLEERNQVLAEQRAELVRSQQLLTQRSREIAEASRYKSEFLANMSHELRTPLNSALILAKLLADNKGGNMTAEQVKFAETIYAAGNDLLRLINDVLDLSKIEAGKLEVHPTSATVGSITSSLERMFAPLAKSKGLQFTVAIAPDAPRAIETDVQRLQQVLRNLLSNAIKFTERGKVELRIDQRDRMLAFAVRDTGIGIAHESYDLIFDAFKQADGTTSRKYGGTGLGLSISRDLARMLGGDIALASTPGEGSTFTLTVPVSYSGRPVAPPSEPSVRLPEIEALVRDETAITVAPRLDFTDDRGAVTPGTRLVLLIEDDVRFAKIIYDLAHEQGFSCICATSAAEGITLAHDFAPAAIILDMSLPDDSGLTVLERLKHESVTRHIPTHVLSAYDHAQTALELGAIGYAMKPIGREHLEALFKKLESQFDRRIRRILIVEDDPVQRDSVAQLLAGDGIEIVTVATGTDALEKLRRDTFDCVVLDLKLPDQSGHELLATMASDEAYAFPPVIVYTGRSLSSDEEAELRRYSSSIIVKGARSPERLLDEVTLFLHQVEARLPLERQRLLRDARSREAMFENRRVLVVEDDVRNVFALASILEPKGAEVDIARNGREAIDMLEKGATPDLVLMDIMMPEMDGITATKAIRAKGGDFAKLPIIALTAKAMRDDRERCIAAGANDYLAKPIDIDKLLSLARVWMGRARN